MTLSIKKTQGLEGFDPQQVALFHLLSGIGIEHVTYEHPAIFTVEEGMALDLPRHIPGQHGKSLFLTNKDGEFWLVVAREETRVDLKSLSDRLQAKRFSFAKPEKMLAVLGVVPGSATPFALMHDQDKIVHVVIEENYKETEYCVFHPLRNTHSTVVRFADLLRFIEHLGYQPVLMPLA